MRLEDCLNQTIAASTRAPKSTPMESKSPSALAPRQDSVTISSAARQASAAQIKAPTLKVLEETAPTDESQAIRDYKKLMDKILGRNIKSIPRSKKEKREELLKELEKLKEALEKTQADPAASAEEKRARAEAIQKRIKAVMEQIAELSQLIDEESAEDLAAMGQSFI